jgi:hypothetical protein
MSIKAVASILTVEPSILRVRHLSFYVNFLQHCNITSLAAPKRLNCVKIIKPGAIKHKGRHSHTNDERPLHFCESR